MWVPSSNAQEAFVDVEFSEYERLIGESFSVKIFGDVDDKDKGGRIIVSIITPTGEIIENRIYATDKGYFEMYYQIHGYSDLGTYEITAEYRSEIIGSSAFNVIDLSENLTEYKKTVNENEESKIPSWVRNIFEWYGQDMVSENELLNAIKFLVNEKIIDIT